MGKTTSKKVKILGKAEYTNNETGEVEVMNVISVEERDFNFHKLWLKNIVDTIDLVGNQKVKLVFWIIEQLDRENKLTYTVRQIQEETKMSLQTISDTLKALMSSNFLKKKHSGCYIVNPDVLFKGTRCGRMNVLIQYQDTGKKKILQMPKKNEEEDDGEE